MVTSLAAVAEAVPTGEFAVIGGPAVLARLQGAHRVTYDLDTVATRHGDELTAVEPVIGTDGVNGLLLGTKIVIGSALSRHNEYGRWCLGRAIAPRS